MLGPAGLDSTALHSTPLQFSVLTATNVSLESSSSGGHQAVPVLGTLATASSTLGQHGPGLDMVLSLHNSLHNLRHQPQLQLHCQPPGWAGLSLSVLTGLI